MQASLSTMGAPMNGTAPLVDNLVCFITAGTTQTQAAATAITAPEALVTTGNASDGVFLPDGSNPANIGMGVIVKNLSANALKVYPFYNTTTSTASGGNINNAAAAGTANASFTHAASGTYLYRLVGLDVWKAILLS